MCTVLFIPGKERRLLVSLRDEKPARAAARPELYRCGPVDFLAPADTLGGTWAGVNNYGHAIILLNGAFERHGRLPAYKKSRGLIVKDLLCSMYPVISWTVMDLDGIEPFTLITYSDDLLFRLSWDGMQKYKQLLDREAAHIFSSATLYDAAARAHREQLFQQWMRADIQHDPTTVNAFFQTYTDAEHGFLNNRADGIATIAASFIEMDEQNAMFTYTDLLQQQTSVCSLALRTSSKITHC